MRLNDECKNMELLYFFHVKYDFYYDDADFFTFKC